ncbi:septal ring lytic transglycosylase RlpA family protein [Halopseudomonas salina]|uniref:Endolytic peptidoglycan transglycosylase RlpA n=1 Tax=Halopseudomonas salina TaxID=1323744 RepID=A0ABQ1P4T9_9GAMM|nr:septal ring lytic transglycosylase RlpA family protein [Halopseudomonas salina]GGC91040.1 RplA family protein [Halopseudomonas salina]
MQGLTRTFWLLLLLFAVSGCSTSQASANDKWVGHTETGQASYYADRYLARPTASGELYQAGENTAAHRTLPFGSMVRVTNLKNGKSVVVRINDRGPFVRGRIIDLSRAAFESIGRASEGLLRVEIEVIR